MSQNDKYGMLAQQNVDWKNNPQYYEYLLKLLDKTPRPPWKLTLNAMIEKFPGVNFTLDSIQSYHKGRVVINKAVSEVTSSSVDKDIDFPSDDEDTNNNNNKPKPKPMQNASVATKLETTFKKTLETNMKEIDEEIARLQAEKKQIEEQLAVLNLALGELNIGSNQKSKK
jgi:hypothetical protein